MKNSVGNWTFWCRRNDLLIEFEISVGTPYLDGDSWICEWSMGNLFPHPLAPAVGVSSMHSLICSLVGMRSFLQSREEQGDKFYCGDSSEDNLVNNIGDLFWQSGYTP